MSSLRVVLSIVLSLVLALPLPVAFGQSPPPTGDIGEVDNTVVLPDGDKDVRFRPASQPDQNASSLGNVVDTPMFDHLDVLKVVMGSENESHFKISLYLKALVPTPDPRNPVDQRPVFIGARAVYFEYGQNRWRVNYASCQRAAPDTGCLQFFRSGGGGNSGWGNSRTISIEQLNEQRAVVFSVPKNLIYDENRVEARFGTVLRNVHAITSQTLAGGFGGFFGGGGQDNPYSVNASDFAPNTGGGPAFTLVKGANGHGSLGFFTLIPKRVSNGEATTIVYKIDLINRGTIPLTVRLEARDLPTDWSARVPSLIKIPGSSNLTLPVVLSLPFRHEHGKTFTFTVHAEATEDPQSYADQQLGVYYTDVPQPSAHHQGKQWFHSAPADPIFAPYDTLYAPKRIWMNGEPQDPDPDANDAPYYQTFQQGLLCGMGQPPGSCAGGKFRAEFWFPLDPGLLIGLDFNTKLPATAAFTLMPVFDSPATVHVELRYCEPQVRTSCDFSGGGGFSGGYAGYNQIVGSVDEATTFAREQPKDFNVSIPIGQAFDLLEYVPGHNLGLLIRVDSDHPQNFFAPSPAISINPETAILVLPLFEYHDPVSQLLQNLGTLEMSLETPDTKDVNPGKTTVFKVRIRNSAAVVQKVALSYEGPNKEWARLVGGEFLSLAPGESRPFTVAIDVPETAAADEYAQLFVIANNVQDQTISTAISIKARVVTGIEIPDESGEAKDVSSTRSTPGFEVAFWLAALALAGVWRRRRSL